MVKCKYCGREFKNINAYNAHKCEGFINELKEKRLQKIVKQNEYKFECEGCHRKFKTYNSLKSHHGHCKNYHSEHKQSKYKISEDLYRCECGREFNNPQSLNGHLSHCKYHHECVGTEIKKRPHELNHEMAGWNKFTKEDKERIYNTMRLTLIDGYKQGTIIPWWIDDSVSEKNKERARMKLSECASNRRDKGEIPCKGISGWYKGIHCDSSWELAFVIYHIDHGIPIQRCKNKINYMFNNRIKTYNPDFIVNNTDTIEIKGYKDERWPEKQKYCEEYNIIIIDDKGIIPYLKYVINAYGRDFIKLYEN